MFIKPHELESLKSIAHSSSAKKKDYRKAAIEAVAWLESAVARLNQTESVMSAIDNYIDCRIDERTST